MISAWINGIWTVIIAKNQPSETCGHPGWRCSALYTRNMYLFTMHINGQTETMETKWANLKKMEEETFAKIVMGKADISEFDTFVENWKKQGGDQILKEINEELGKLKGQRLMNIHQPLVL